MKSSTLAALIGLVLLAAGCTALKPKYVPIRSYTLATEVEVARFDAPAGEALGVRRFSAPGRYGLPLVYRLSDVLLDTYEYDRWVEPPEEMLTQTFVAAFRASGLFRLVEPADALRRPRFELAGDLLRFEEVRNGAEHRAQCAVRVRLLQADTVLWAETFAAAVPVEGAGAAAAVRALNAAVQQVVREAVAAAGAAVLASNAP